MLHHHSTSEDRLLVCLPQACHLPSEVLPLQLWAGHLVSLLMLDHLLCPGHHPPWGHLLAFLQVPLLSQEPMSTLHSSLLAQSMSQCHTVCQSLSLKRS